MICKFPFIFLEGKKKKKTTTTIKKKHRHMDHEILEQFERRGKEYDQYEENGQEMQELKSKMDKQFQISSAEMKIQCTDEMQFLDKDLESIDEAMKQIDQRDYSTLVLSLFGLAIAADVGVILQNPPLMLGSQKGVSQLLSQKDFMSQNVAINRKLLILSIGSGPVGTSLNKRVVKSPSIVQAQFTLTILQRAYVTTCRGS